MIKFGTDGVRGVANTELTPQLAFELGRAGAYVLKSTGTADILVGKDTRISSDMLEAALVSGICSVGGNAHLAGFIPTPAIATLVKKYGMAAGVMISASHNPVEDNGIKFFNSIGYKLDDTLEKEIEDILNNRTALPQPTGADVGRIQSVQTAVDDYTAFLKQIMGNISLKGLKVGIDCANGATYSVAPRIMEQLNATLFPIHITPTGTNINENCGSTHMNSIAEHVKKNKLDIGIAFDGDGDRCLMVDAKGNVLCGDSLMSICGNVLKEEGRLNKNTIVATTMSNLGLRKMGEKMGIEIIETNVGDRYVLEAMIAGGYNFGGEQSGHFIFLDYTTTGDGLLTALQILKFMVQKNTTLHQLNTYMKKYPQVLVNATVKNEVKGSYNQNPVIAQAITATEALFAENGRVLIRPSGTEPLIRIMIEGTDMAVLEKEANNLKAIIEKELHE